MIQTLTRNADGTYYFVDGGIAITYPLESSCGRFTVSPADYGFSEYCTGGNCKAWRRDFVLADETPVYMLLTDEDAGIEFDEGQAILIGVYETHGEGFIHWIKFPGPDEDSPASDIYSEGWNHAE